MKWNWRLHRGRRVIQIPTQKQEQKQKQTIVNDREHRDGCTNWVKPKNDGRVWGTSHGERLMTAMSKARAMINETSKRKFCELTDAKWWIGAELLEPNEARGWETLFRDHSVLGHEPLRSFRHSWMVKMQLTRLGNVELYRPESVGRRACWVLRPVVLPRLTRESCIEKVQLARERECSNSDMLSTMTLSFTLYIHAHLPSVHSPDQV